MSGAAGGPRHRLSINQATTETSGTEELIAACAAAGVDAVAPWRHKYLDGDVHRTRRALDANGVQASSLCRGGFFTGTRPPAETARDNRAAVEEAAILGAPVLVLVCGPVTDAGPGVARDRIRAGIEDLLPVAAEHNIVLAVEPFHPMFLAERSAIVTLDQAVDLVEQIDHPHLGIAVDTYHVWWDPNLPEALSRASARTVGIHVADWVVPTPSLLAGRGLPGDGVVDLPAILHPLLRTGYQGSIEVEVLNEDVWATPVTTLVGEVRRRMDDLMARIEVAA